MIPAMKWLAPAVLACLALFAGLLSASAEEGWRVTFWHSRIAIDADGNTHFVETITVDWGALARHGIFRDLRTRVACDDAVQGPEPVYECPGGSDRVYPLTGVSVTDGAGQSRPYSLSRVGVDTRLKIGDPDRTVTGVQVYQISYTVVAALNAFEGHDELYWNVTGSEWGVPIDSVRVDLSLPRDAGLFVACFEGYRSTAPCDSEAAGRGASFATTRTLFPGEELTIAAGWDKGAVDVLPPVLEDRTSIDDFFTLDWVELGGAALVLALALGAVARLWWLRGRDRRYQTLYYLTEDPSEETARLFADRNVVVEFLPPEDLHPAQMGVIIDERADTLDVTSTIIDLAVRGYLHITEIPKEGWFGRTDWELTKKKEAGDDLLPYERRLFNSLFRNRETVRVSKLKTTFAEHLAKVKKDLYKDALGRHWFSSNPETARRFWLAVGAGTIAVGLALCLASGLFIDRALVPAGVFIAGALMLFLSRSMARRTAQGSEALRRVLGFKRYIATAETRRQEFNEQQNIFARYLPFAIVFECVDRWADAFEGLDDQVGTETAYWYAGATPLQVGAFTAGMSTFSSSVSSAMASTPGGSGGSGFSGGFSGGGGGGGGGGSW